MDLLRITVWCTISVSIIIFPWVVTSAPIKVDFSQCQPAQYRPIFGNTTAATPFTQIQCCPNLPTTAEIRGLPPPTTPSPRVRKAIQCGDANYAAQLEKAYDLMKALPEDDPRSFTEQWLIHCSYCGGSFYSTDNRNTTAIGIGIHWSWLFYSWYRYYVYFHERILQSLLGDPTFSINFWNWDNPFTVEGYGDSEACLKSGQDFPIDLYSDPASSTFDSNRSDPAKGIGPRFPFPDVTFSFLFPVAQQPLANASAEDLIKNNLNVMYQSMVSGGTTPETFVGLPYRVGDPRGNPRRGPGSLEAGPHTGVHSWIGKPPYDSIDMGTVPYAARDPVFFAHHTNVDRLFQVWKDIGPLVGQNRDYGSDPDFLNAEFLFYDENADLRRVTVGEGLDTTKLGYVYQKVNDAAWIYYNQTRCSSGNISQLVVQAECVPAPIKDDKGDYVLQPGKPIVLVIDRPENPNGDEEFLTIAGIKMSRSRTGGFDVYVNLPFPGNYTYPSQCAEYNGRFTNMPQSNHDNYQENTVVWKQSVSRTLSDIEASSSSKVVVTIVPLARRGRHATIKFSSIYIET